MCGGVYLYVCVSPRQQWLVSNTLAGIKHWACGSDLTLTPLRKTKSVRLTGSVADWSTVWLTHHVIDMTASCPSEVGGVRVRTAAHWRKMFWWISSDWLSVALQQYPCLLLYSESSIEEISERTCWRTLDGTSMQHLWCISIYIYWTLKCRRLIHQKVNATLYHVYRITLLLCAKGNLDILARPLYHSSLIPHWIIIWAGSAFKPVLLLV